MLHHLPTLNALLNATSAVLVVLAYRAIRRLEIETHRTLMLSAAVTSGLFLVTYLTYHAQVGSVPFTAQGLPRAIYFTVLISHTILAVFTLPLVLRTLYLGLKRRDDRHRRIARWTLPIWLYVSVTGVVVYVMLYHLYPSRALR
jgi:putative membrane protein